MFLKRSSWLHFIILVTCKPWCRLGVVNSCHWSKNYYCYYYYYNSLFIKYNAFVFELKYGILQWSWNALPCSTLSHSIGISLLNCDKAEKCHDSIQSLNHSSLNNGLFKVTHCYNHWTTAPWTIGYSKIPTVTITEPQLPEQ